MALEIVPGLGIGEYRVNDLFEVARDGTWSASPQGALLMRYTKSCIGLAVDVVRGTGRVVQVLAFDGFAGKFSNCGIGDSLGPLAKQGFFLDYDDVWVSDTWPGICFETDPIDGDIAACKIIYISVFKNERNSSPESPNKSP